MLFILSDCCQSDLENDPKKKSDYTSDFALVLFLGEIRKSEALTHKSVIRGGEKKPHHIK